jgi:hypothetical protein
MMSTVVVRRRGDRDSAVSERRFIGRTLPMLAAVAILLGAGAGPPEIKRVRLPADRVGALFPGSTAIRGLSADEFEALVAKARRGADRQAGASPPRLLRARHSARWEDGVLKGRSELVIDGSGPSELELVPWTPAIEVAADADSPLRSRDSGGTAVRVEGPGLSTIVLNWQLRARPGTKMRGFLLGLPSTDASQLRLDLPEGWIAEGPTGLREGPDAGATPGRSSWTFSGRGGLINLQLGAPGDREGQGRDAGPESRAAVQGPTRIDLNEAEAKWRTDWTVTLDPQGPRTLRFELDPGLDLIDVSGPDVEEVHPEASGNETATRATITFDDATTGSTTVAIRALARVPSVGSWLVPAVRPLDALWMGGTTSVRLDPGRVIEDCRERAGRRTSARPGETLDPALISFVASAPRSVAELVFRAPWADVSAEVRGHLLLGNAAPRLVCRIAWTVVRGPLLALDVDLPAAWVPDRVQVEGSDETITWRAEVRPDGGDRLHVSPPSGDLAHRPLVLNIAATATIAGGRGPLTLPRVRPLGVRVSDELWVARIEPILTLQPTHAHGLAWINPRLVDGPAGEASNGQRDTLAWRWIADTAEGRVDRERIEADPGAAIDLRAVIDHTRLRLDGRIAIQAEGEPIATIPLTASEPIDRGEWQAIDRATGQKLTRRPLDTRRRAALGFSETGPAWEIVLPQPERGRLTIDVRLERPWNGRGGIPLLALPERFQTRGTVLVLVARDMLSTAESSGLRALDPAVTARTIAHDATEARNEPNQATHRREHAFGYSRPGSRLVLKTEDLQPARTGGVIRDAVLTSYVVLPGPNRHHLTLRVAADGASALDLTLPPGAVPTRLRRDGQAIAPAQVGRVLSVPLPGPRPARAPCTVTLDYVTPSASFSSRATIRPERPETSLPCLSFCWEVVAPATWAVDECGPGLVAADPAPPPLGTFGLLGAWRTSWNPFRRASTASGDPSMLRALDERVAATRPDEVALGAWFTRWDAGPRPVVIDRLALASAGYGPKSRVVPPREGTARSSLQPLGLTVVPVGTTLLITSRSEAPDRPGGPLGDLATRLAWENALRTASASGSDPSDRFQSVSRWRGAVTPKVSVLSENTDLDPLAENRRIWRFTAPGWPDSGATVRLVDQRDRSAWSWTVGLAVVLAGLVIRSASTRVRGTGLALVLGLATLATGLVPSWSTAIATGAAAGGLTVLFVWLGQALPAIRRRRAFTPVGSSSLRRRATGAGISAVLLVGLGLRLSTGGARAQMEEAADAPILAVFPYEGPPRPDWTPDRVLLRLVDYQRLRALADLAEAQPEPSLRALDVHHRVRWGSGRALIVESVIGLLLEDQGQAAWSFPVENAREISATLDESAVPVLVRPGGKTGVVMLSGSGRKRLTVRRTVFPRPDGSVLTLDLPVNAVASARVEVEREPGGPAGLIEIPSARGTIASSAEGAEGLLGPADRLEVRWPARQPGAAIASGTVEGLLIWDAEPAGDRVRAHLTLRKPGGTSVLRLGLEPGLVVRSHSIPGLIDATVQGTAEHPEWVARIDPPLPEGTTVGLEFWRSAPDRSVPAALPPRGPGLAGSETVQDGERTTPRIDPIGVERYSGALAFRRPADWSGRLAPGPGSGAEPLSDEAFVRLWGTLPEEPLTLSGVVRFAKTPDFALRTGRVAARLAITPDVLLTISSGRLDLDVHAELLEHEGRIYLLVVEIPESLQILAIEGEGLTDWSRPEQGRLRLRFDSAAIRVRTVRLRGWLPLAVDPMATAGQGRQREVPWPRWADVEERPGTLTIVSPNRFELLAPPGAPPFLAPASASGVFRAIYRVEKPNRLGRLRWEAEQPSSDVVARSQLTLLPDSAEWVAAVRYDISQGSLDAIHLRLPTDWAGAARVSLVGVGHQLAAAAHGATTDWTIRPERPIWGSQRLVVRAVLPLPRSGELTFPDLVPLGRGSADRYLSLVNASGREPVMDATPGLLAIDESGLFPADEFARPIGVPAQTYHVQSERWSLRLRMPVEPRGTGEDRVSVSLADLSCTVLADGATLGLARYDVESGSGPFLGVQFADGLEPLWASVNNAPAELLRTATGRWLIPLDEAGAGQVALVWKAPGVRPVGNGAHPLTFPSLGRSRLFQRVNIHAPESIALTCTPEGLEPVALERLELDRAERLEKRTIQGLARLDRTSLRERESLVSNLVQVGLFLRNALRAVAGESSATTAPRALRLRRVQERVEMIRKSASDAIATAGLEEFEQSAQVHLGQADEDPETTITLEIPEPAATLPIAHLGNAHAFQGETRGETSPAPLTWSTLGPARLGERAGTWMRAFTLIAVVLLVLAAIWAERSSWLAATYLVIGLAALAWLAGPIPFGTGLAATALGWLSRPGAPGRVIV